MHEALTSDADSLHITSIGVNVYSWIDAVRAAVDSCADDIDFRRSVPVDGEQSGRPPGTSPRAARRRGRVAQDAVAAGTEPPAGPRGAAEPAPRPRPSQGRHRAQRRPTVIADLERGPDGAALIFEGKRISFPAQADEAVAFAATTDSASRAGDMPGALDEPGRLVLVRRSVREGFLLVNATPPDAHEGRTGADGTG